MNGQSTLVGRLAAGERSKRVAVGAVPTPETWTTLQGREGFLTFNAQAVVIFDL